MTPLAVLAIAAGIASQYIPDDWLDRVQDGFAGRRPVMQGAYWAWCCWPSRPSAPQGVAPFIYYRF